MDQEKRETFDIWGKVIVGCLPAAVIGLAFNDKIDALFYNAQTVAFTLILYGILFIVVENHNKNKESQVKELSDLTYKIALIIGCFQVLALIPGTSRSGATIIGAMLLGTSRFVAAEYSFFLSIPVMFGASFLKLVKYGFHYTGNEVAILVVGMVVAFIVSILAIKFLLGYIKNNDFKAFGVGFIKKKLKIDDALDAFGCHGIGGIWGGIATGIFTKSSINPVAKWDGLIYGDYHLFAAQIIGIILTIAVAVVGTLICVAIVRIFTPLRVSVREEQVGLDISEHGESAYPSFNGLDQ